MNIQQTPEQQPTQPMPKPLSNQENSVIGSAWDWVGKVSGLLTACLPSSCAFKVPEDTEVVNLNSGKLPKIESNCEIEEMIVHAIHEVKEDSIDQENNEINRESNQELGAISEEEMNRLMKKHTSEYGIPQRSFEHEDLYRVGQDDLIHARGDFKTAQGLEAAKKTFVTAGALTSFVARTKEPVIDTLLAEALSPREQFLKIMDAIDVCLDEADLNDPKECKFLNDLAGLLHKGFNPDTGGIGCLHNRDGWNKSWNELGNGKNTATSFSKDNEHNEEVTQSFRKMLAYYQANAASHFCPERHEGGRILAALQTMGTIGQLLNDFAFNQDYPKAIRNVLEQKMVDNELVHSSLISQEGFAKRVEETKNKMRSNPLLAEVSNKNVSAEIVAQLKSPGLSEKLISIIEKQLNKIDPENKMSKEEKQEIANFILGN